MALKVAYAGGVGNADSYRDRVANLPTLLSFEEYCAAHPFLTLVSDKVCYHASRYGLRGSSRGAGNYSIVVQMRSAYL